MLQSHHQENEMTTQRTGEIFACHISDKGLVSRLYKDLIMIKIMKGQISQLENGQCV